MGDGDGLAGEIEFPTTTIGGGPVQQLREDIVNEALGMPRDLNGDGIDALDHAPSDYLALPTTILVRWVGANGNCELRLDLVLVQ